MTVTVDIARSGDLAVVKILSDEGPITKKGMAGILRQLADQIDDAQSELTGAAIADKSSSSGNNSGTGEEV